MFATPPLPPAGNRPIARTVHVLKAGWTEGAHPRGYHGRWVTVFHGSRHHVPSTDIRAGLKPHQGEAWVTTSREHAAGFGPPVELRLRVDDGVYPDTHPLASGAYRAAQKRLGTRKPIDVSEVNAELASRGVKAVAEQHAGFVNYRIIDPSIVEGPVSKAGWAENLHPRGAGGRFAVSSQRRPSKRRRKKRLSRIHGHEHITAAKVMYELTHAPPLTPEQQAWLDAQDVSPDLKPYVAAAISFWGLKPQTLSMHWADLSDPKYGNWGGAVGVTWLAQNGAATVLMNTHYGDLQVKYFAVAIAHEFGHALGLPHSETGIMQAILDDAGVATYPYYQEHAVSGLVDEHYEVR